MFKVLSLVLFIGFSQSAWAERQGCSIEDCSISRVDYERVMSNFRELYSDVTFVANWLEDEPQAFASFGRVFMSGGFARKDDISLGGFVLVSCHEVGHAKFSLNEGEADYFSTKECMKDYLKAFPEDVSVLSGGVESSVFSQACSSVENLKECVAILVSAQIASQADANRCVKRLGTLEKQVINSRRQFFRVSEFNYRCLRTDVDVKTPSFLAPSLLKSIDKIQEVLSFEVSIFVDDERVVSVPYRQHNSPFCRMQTLRRGYFDKPEPACWSL